MSHTDKDMPYWVRLNNEGTSTSHDHLYFGRPIIKHVWLEDEDGNPVYKDEPILRRAESILDNSLYGGYYSFVYNSRDKEWRDEFGAYREPIMRAAHALVNAGRGREYVEIGVHQIRVSETKIVGHYKDHCTAGEKPTSARNKWGHEDGALPCVPEFSGADSWWHYGTTSQRCAEHERYFTAERTKERASLGRAIKLWNSGESVEDWDERDVLTHDIGSFLYW